MNRIREFRKKKKMSQYDIAEIMKLKQNTISQWENETRLPNVRQALMLAEILDTTIESLYKENIPTVHL